MADSILPGFNGQNLEPFGVAHDRYILVESSLHRVLAFTGHSIDDVFNDSFARNRVIYYCQLHRWIGRESQRSELERQWNRLGIFT